MSQIDVVLKNFQDPELEDIIIATMIRHPEHARRALYNLDRAIWDEYWTTNLVKQVATLIRDMVNREDSTLPNERDIVKTIPDADEYFQKIEPLAQASIYLSTRSTKLDRLTRSRLFFLKCLGMADKVQQGAQEGKLEEYLSAATEQIKQIPPTTKPYLCVEEAMSEIKTMYQNRFDHPERLGLKTEIQALDKHCGGLPYGVLNLLAARPSHGKTALALQISINVALQGYPVLIFSHEMDFNQIVNRIACNLAGTHLQYTREGRLSQNCKERFFAALEQVKKLPITINAETQNRKTRECVDKFKYFVSCQSGKPGLVMVDYIQLQRLDAKEARSIGTRADEIEVISGLWLNALQETKYASLILAQLNRVADGKMPKLSELRGSGSLEQDAHTVTLMHRPGHDDPTISANQINLAMPKNRDGSLWEQKLHFTGYCQRVRNWDVNDIGLNKTEWAKAEGALTSEQMRTDITWND